MIVDGHIHFGAKFLGKDFKAWENFFTIYKECEELFYKITNREGQPPRKGITQYAQTSNYTISTTFENGEISIKAQKDLDLIIEALKDTRNRGINFCNIDEDGINTIEFRMPNGEIDIDVIRENIRLFGQLLNVSKQMSKNPEYKKYTFLELKEHDLTEREKLESLLNLLFDDEHEKDIYRRRWDAVKENKSFEELKAEVPTFQRGNYSMREQVADIYRETKAIDRINFVKMVKATIFKISHIDKKQR